MCRPVRPQKPPSCSHKECTPAKVLGAHHRDPRRPHPIHDVHPFLQDTTKLVHAATPSSLDAFREDQGHNTLQSGDCRGRCPARAYRRVVDEVEHIRPEDIPRQVRPCSFDPPPHSRDAPGSARTRSKSVNGVLPSQSMQHTRSPTPCCPTSRKPHSSVW